MIAARPNRIPQFGKTYGADQPRPMKFKLPHTSYQNQIKRPKVEITPLNPLSMIQRNPLDQSLPAMNTPFDLRHSISKLSGISGFYGSTTQNGKPLRAQKGLGKDNLQPRKPLINSNF